MLQRVLEGAMKEKNLSARDVGKALGVSHTTVLRAAAGEAIDLPTLIKIANWLKIRPAALLDSMGDDDSLDARIAILYDAYPELRTVLEHAAKAISDGDADPSIIKDIVAYAEFRISKA